MAFFDELSSPLPLRESAANAPSVALPHTAPRTYADLKRQVKAQGLLDKQPLYYAIRVSVNLALYAFSVAFLFLADGFWLQLLVGAPLLAFAYAQVAFVAHNSGHRQVGLAAWQDELITISHFGLLLGTSASWWVDKHNEHHGSPNVLDTDPDIDFPVVAFTEEQALSKRGLARFMVTYQAYFFCFLVTLVPFNMRFHSVRKLLSGTARHAWLEALLMAAHVFWYIGVLLLTMGPWQALLFAGLHHALVGLYMAFVFAVNHKGMPVLEKEHQLDFLRLQVLTSRNVKAHPLTDFLYGGLNYQIEHHLFPTMPQNKLRAGQQLVRAYCEAQGIPYHETGFVQAQREVLQHLHRVSAPLRAPRQA